MKRCYAAVWLAFALWTPWPVHARATLVANIQGNGFSDSTPTTPVGGNTGTTLGAQRKFVVQRALEMWGAVLDSDVPIKVDVSFIDLGCSDFLTAAQAAPIAFYSELPIAGIDSKALYVSALANKLVGFDIDPSESDIDLQVNSALDGGCTSVTAGYYYGVDGRGGDLPDLLTSVLHELGHGLGILSTVDLDTGELYEDRSDPYTNLVRDADKNKLWPDLSAAERLQSAQNVRHLAWDGDEVTRLTTRLTAGEPTLTFEPSIANYTGIIATSNLGQNPATQPARGPVVSLNNCSLVQGVAAGSVLLLPEACAIVNIQLFLTTLKPSALLVPYLGTFISPPLPIDSVSVQMGTLEPLDVPILIVSEADAAAIGTAASQGTLTANLGGSTQQRLGADTSGRLLLFASQPVLSGTTLSHVEPLIQPSELMEPTLSEPVHDLTLAAAMLADIGWSGTQLSAAEGSGIGAQPVEVAGSGGSIPVPDTTGTLPSTSGAAGSYNASGHCGDGVVDDGEECDGADDCTDDCQFDVSTNATADTGKKKSGGCSAAPGLGASNSPAWLCFVATALWLRRRRHRASVSRESAGNA
jgi:hypothetical protein